MVTSKSKFLKSVISYSVVYWMVENWLCLTLSLTISEIMVTFLDLSDRHEWVAQDCLKIKSSTYWYLMTYQVSWNSNHWFLTYHCLQVPSGRGHSATRPQPVYPDASGDIIILYYILMNSVYDLNLNSKTISILNRLVKLYVWLDLNHIILISYLIPLKYIYWFHFESFKLIYPHMLL